MSFHCSVGVSVFPCEVLYAVVAPLWWPGWVRTDGRLRWLVSLFSRVAEQPH